ncbi:Uncharacterised protein [Bordetella pertussis]|nr:Uncharacterised protein [Bordetella pertussis]
MGFLISRGQRRPLPCAIPRPCRCPRSLASPAAAPRPDAAVPPPPSDNRFAQFQTQPACAGRCRPAAPDPRHRRRGHPDQRLHGDARIGHRQHGAAGHRRRPGRKRSQFDLGHQRLPPGHGGGAAAHRVAGRDHRPSPHFHGRPGAVHPGLPGVRPGAFAAVADRRTAGAGRGRGRHPGRGAGHDALCLSARTARARPGPERAGRQPVAGGRPHCGFADPQPGQLALAVPDQRAAGPAGPGAGRMRAAAHPAQRTPLRCRRGPAVRAVPGLAGLYAQCLRARCRRRRQHRLRACHAGNAGAAAQAPIGPRRAHAGHRPAAPPHLRAVGRRHAGRFRGPDAGLRRPALHAAKPAGLHPGADRLPDHALAGAVGPPSARPARRHRHGRAGRGPAV